jgi:hypothetical protein
MKVKHILTHFYISDLEGPAEQAVAFLQKLLADYSGKDIRLEHRDDYEGDTQIYVVHDREETETETTARLQQEQWQKDYRRQQFEILKKEFGG